MRIYNNVNAVNAQRNLSITGFALAKSIEKLSSGLRINRAADDAAGLSISEKLRAQIRGVMQAMRNAQDGVSMIQTAEGALNEVHSMLQRMRELAVQAANDTLTTEDRRAIYQELDNLRVEVDAIVARTSFNGKNLLDGTLVTTVAAGSEIKVGTTLTGGGETAHVFALDVSGAVPGRTYTFSYNSTTDTLTLTRSGDNVSQSITISNIAAGGSQVLNFSALGIKLTVTSTGGITADNLGAALTAGATDTITTHNGGGSANMQVGPNSTHSFNVNFSDVRVSGTASAMTTLDSAITAFSTSLSGLNSAQVTAAQNLINALDGAISYVNEVRSYLGAVQNRLEHAIANLGVQHENLTASESRIRDVDMAKEMVIFTRNQILQQAGVAVLSQANAMPQSVLQLLR
ncbi:flagellin [Thermomicrobium roseum]|uniref:Flagellin n=1 Tax=Thermomicrobium roseum (strain ATCC 27502 / DSM 5159 / P-2) TaxID=309801 RepID=B9L344_THERP|nr:flagellin [Thermomicrobium roseum]ACM06785.1 flagellin [Thermomicrobium roseum DSM 5159]